MDKILFDCGILPPKFALEIVESSCNQIIFISNVEKLAKALQSESEKITVCMYPNLSSKNKIGNFDDSDVESLTAFLIDNHLTFQLYDRTNRRFFEFSSMKIVRIMASAAACLEFLKMEKPRCVLFGATPHHIDTWILGKTAEFLGLPVYYFQFTPFLWRHCLMLGLDKKTKPVSLQEEKISELEVCILKDYLALKAADYDKARPQYITNQMGNVKSKSFFRLGKQLNLHFRRPDLILNNFICQQFYKFKAKNYTLVPGGKEIIFFLHYQPERTTLPDAFGFSQQLLALHQLIIATKGKYRILVKEHPTTFLVDCRWKERNLFWYRSLASYPSIQFVPMDADPFELIRRSVFVATISGSSAFEALLRGKPALIFSPSSFQGLRHPSVHRYRNLDCLKKWIQGLDEEEHTVFNAYQYIQDISSISRSGLIEGDDLTQALKEYEGRSRYLSWKRLFLDFFR